MGWAQILVQKFASLSKGNEIFINVIRSLQQTKTSQYILGDALTDALSTAGLVAKHTDQLHVLMHSLKLRHQVNINQSGLGAVDRVPPLLL